jgi:hypothetical protein
MWTRQSLSNVRGPGSGIGDQISFGGRPARGFALAGPSDPEIWTKLTPEKQQWVMDSLVMLNNLIYQTTGTKCATWAPAITAAGGCFQGWFNSAGYGMTKADGSPVILRTDGVFDQDTLDALRTVAALDLAHFPTPFPGTASPGFTGTGEKKLSKGAVAFMAAGGVAVVGGIAYAATRKKKKG